MSLASNVFSTQVHYCNQIIKNKFTVFTKSQIAKMDLNSLEKDAVKLFQKKLPNKITIKDPKTQKTHKLKLRVGRKSY